MVRRLLLLVSLTLPAWAGGCAIVEVGVRNPVVGLETVAVVPFFNLSQERAVDGREFALAYYSELQKVPGFEVLPVGVAERAILENGLTMSGPGDAVRLAEILDVDAVVVGAVTDYDPYNPRIGLKVAWYSPQQWLFLANEPPERKLIENPLRRPKYTMSRAQSPDDESGNLADVDIETIEEGDWEAISAKITEERLLADARPTGSTGQTTSSRIPFLVPVSALKTSETKPKTPRHIIPVQAQQEATLPVVPAPAAEEESDSVVPAQASGPPPGQFQPPVAAQPLAPASSATGASSLPAEPALPQGVPVPPSDPFAGPVSSNGPSMPNDLFPADNPFDSRRREGVVAKPSSEMNRLVPEINDSPSSSPPPRIASAQSGLLAPPISSSQKMASDRGAPVDAAPVMTPLFPMPESRPTMDVPPVPRATVPGLKYDEEVVLAPESFDSQEPLMAYVRLFDSTDRRLIARLSDYLELTGQMRSGDLQAYMKRSEFFRKFTAHVMISEMLTLHGGEARRQLVLKTRKYR